MSLNADRIRALSIDRYRERAAGYDASCGRTWPIREQAIAQLHLDAGQCVVDVGCGTGLSFELLRQAVGEQGRVIGVEQSPDMAAIARQRIDDAGWSNVELIVASAQDARFGPADAMLFNYTHDICRSPQAVANLLGQLHDNAVVSMAGIKYFPAWLAPLNLYVWFKNRAYNGLPGELSSPWDRVSPHLKDFQMRATQFGMAYLAAGRLDARTLHGRTH